MSLKCYIDSTQAFEKEGAGWLLFGLQSAATFTPLPIYECYPDFITADSGTITVDSGLMTADQVTATIDSFEAVKIDKNGKEISTTTLSINLLKWENSQWLINSNYQYATYLDECIYFLKITTGNTIKTEPFLVSKKDYFIRADMTEITADSGLIRTNTSNINL